MDAAQHCFLANMLNSLISIDFFILFPFTCNVKSTLGVMRNATCSTSRCIEMLLLMCTLCWFCSFLHIFSIFNLMSVSLDATQSAIDVVVHGFKNVPTTHTGHKVPFCVQLIDLAISEMKRKLKNFFVLKISIHRFSSYFFLRVMYTNTDHILLVIFVCGFGSTVIQFFSHHFLK